MAQRPWLWLIAGPNGAGKTTLARHRFGHLVRVNADEIAQQLNPEHPGHAAAAAGRRSVMMIAELLKAGQSFSVETTLSGRMHFRLVQRARAGGWKVGLAYVGIADGEAALARVHERYRRGGHKVPPSDVLRRYHRSMAHLRQAIVNTDMALVYDNSTSNGFCLVLEVENRVVRFMAPEIPRWLGSALPSLPLSVGQDFGPPAETK